MDQFTDSLLKWLAVVGPLLAGVAILWHKIDRIWKSINKINHKKVSRRECKQLRAECPCNPQKKETK